ncbi:hypothetical protein HRD49_06230 [Corallococcus exiguus]|uniref:hypothetical protein n=1 Tax=Corallococcus TaxID=83461 RepID=UPI000EE6F287|nr:MULTISPECIES: hypothetical protein [Corallococcus]NRD61344.1 hypothetical protein [Corallococcus exiguus]RKI18781.1 hypothetical protein D7Y15_07400 [Corallococcus sp. AB030]RUO90281.1 hypothetical protein D7Y11_25845 [Corallococcus sp. AB018]
MIHSDEKVRQMARSLLPSKNREAARTARKHIHRAARKEARQELAVWMKSGDMEHDLPPFAPWERKEISGEVRWRRGGDKVMPFIRWATARTRELRREDRLSHVRSLLPPGVIGEHALGHVEHTTAFRDPTEVEWRVLQWSRSGRKVHRMERGEMAQLLRALLAAPDGHATFNRFLRERHTWTRTVNAQVPENRKLATLLKHRPLLGVHDVLPFLDTLEPAAWDPYFRWGTLTPPLHWARLFLQRFKEHRGCIPSVLAALEAEGLMERAVPPAHPRESPAR